MGGVAWGRTPCWGLWTSVGVVCVCCAPEVSSFQCNSVGEPLCAMCVPMARGHSDFSCVFPLMWLYVLHPNWCSRVSVMNLNFSTPSVCTASIHIYSADVF